MKKDEDLKKIKELLEIVAHKVDMMEVSRTGQSASLHLMKDQQSVMNAKLDGVRSGLDEVRKDLKEVKDTQKQHTEILEKRVLPPVTYIETNIKAYKDSYQINNANAKKLEKRVETLEANADILPPPEYILAEVS